MQVRLKRARHMIGHGAFCLCEKDKGIWESEDNYMMHWKNCLRSRIW